MRHAPDGCERAACLVVPQIICGLSAHPAISKACHYFGIELVKAPLDPTTYRLTPACVQPLITKRTVAIYASAPCFSFGAVDEIDGLGALALRHGCGLHVDNCLGGYLLSYMQKEGLFTSKWDFEVGRRRPPPLPPPPLMAPDFPPCASPCRPICLRARPYYPNSSPS